MSTVKTDMRRGDWVNPTLTRVRVEEWAREWQSTIVHLEPNPVAWYDVMLRVHVLPAIGESPVGAIDRAAVRRFVASLRANGKSSRTVKGAYQTLRHVMATAQGSGAIRVNPCDGVKLPRAVNWEMMFLSTEQVIDLSAATEAPYGTLVPLPPTPGSAPARSAASASGVLTFYAGLSTWPKHSRTRPATCTSDRRRTSSGAR